MSCGQNALLLGLALLGCAADGKPPPVAASPAPAPPAAAAKLEPAPEPAPAPEPPRDSAGFPEALALLRPASARDALAGLEAAPTDPLAYRRAALAYATTDAPGMSLLWGLTYHAAGPGESDAKLAAALAQVLTERISAKPAQQGDGFDFSVRLAPGKMPVREHQNGDQQVPLAHAFEAHFALSLAGFRPPWTLEQFYDVLSNWVAELSTGGSPFKAAVEVDAWLVLLAKAGHLEAYCYQLLGPAYPAELRAYKIGHAAELRAYQEYARRDPLQPRHAPLPDELVQVK